MYLLALLKCINQVSFFEGFSSIEKEKLLKKVSMFKKYDKKGNIRPQEKDWATSEKAISARIFKTYRDRVTKDTKYISMRKMWREYENHNLQELQ